MVIGDYGSVIYLLKFAEKKKTIHNRVLLRCTIAKQLVTFPSVIKVEFLTGCRTHGTAILTAQEYDEIPSLVPRVRQVPTRFHPAFRGRNH